MNTLIIKLDKIRKNDVPKAGGKGANLGELAGNAFPVPPGFVISTDACLQFFNAIALDRMLHDLRDAGPDDIEEHSVKIQEKILKSFVNK